MTDIHQTSLPVALITGASSGIGLELGRLLAADGYDLVLVARDAKKLQSIGDELATQYSVLTHIFPADLADPNACAKIMEFLENRKITVDTLINNAGFGTHGEFATLDLQQELNLLQVNITSLVHLTRLLLPAMLTKKQGQIMNVASVAAFQAGPLMACYYASKAFVLSFTEAVAAETKKTGVKISALCPGPTDTQFHHRAGIADTPLFRSNTMTSQSVAKIGYLGLKKGKLIVIPGFKNKTLALATRFTPRKILSAVAKKLNKSRSGK